MRRAAIAAVFVAFAAPAMAQSTDTRCRVVGDEVYCDSTTTGAAASGVQVPSGWGVQQPQQLDVGAALRQAEEIKRERAERALIEQRAQEEHDRAAAPAAAPPAASAFPPGFMGAATAACLRQFQGDEAGAKKCEDAVIDAIVSE